jgi:hypothetical protein
MTKNQVALAGQVEAIMLENGWAPSVDRQGAQLPFGRIEGGYWVVNGRPNGVDDHVGVAGPGAEFRDPIPLAYALVERAKGLQRAQAELVATTALSVVTPPVVEAEPEPPTPDPRDEELAALRARIAELEQQAKPVEPPEPVIQEPERQRDDLLDFDVDAAADITGDMLLNAFEHDEAETAAVVQTLSATRLRHLSEQLNVERARLDREHQLTGFANPRAASIDRLIGLLTRRGEV